MTARCRRTLLRPAILLLVLLAWCSAMRASAAETSSRPAPPVRQVAPFQLPSTDGQLVPLKEQPDSAYTVICFLGAECPLAKLYAPRLNRLAELFETQDVQFLAINSNRQDSMEDARQYARRHALEFPLAKDFDNVVADQLGATRTPEVFVVDRDRKVRYHGRIDDQYLPGISRNEPEREELREALEALTAGRKVETPRTEPVGCLIGKVTTPPAASPSDATDSVTYCSEVVRVLNRHCVECHRAGDIGPFALTDYDEVIGWSETMLETIEQGRMPPWHANPDFGHFANARHMPERDKQILRAWVDAGHPYGDPAELPELEPVKSGWQSDSDPELVLPMRDRPFVVPATGTVEYQYFVVDPGFTEDKWIRSAEVLPGNREVVHHCIVFIRPPDGTHMDGVGWLTGYVPGSRLTPLPNGYARRVPAGSKLVFQMHYTPTGTEQPDLTRIGLELARPQEVTHEVLTLLGLNQQFEIPPHTSGHVVRGRLPTPPRHSKLLSIMPHMHLRGKSIQLTMVRDGERQILLDVPRYDFNWQHNYELQEPLSLDKDDRLEFTAVFDNSDDNPFNPDPSEYVTWGDQTWEEMALVFVAISRPLNAEGQTTVEDATAPSQRKRTPPSELADDDPRVQRFVRTVLERWDANEDGQVERDEAPLSIRTFGFYKYDHDRDGVATRKELLQAARRSIARSGDRGAE